MTALYGSPAGLGYGGPGHGKSSRVWCFKQALVSAMPWQGLVASELFAVLMSQEALDFLQGRDE
eukprot:6747312-Prorocentrum_lima.AAC.1